MATSVTSTNDVSAAIHIVARRGDTFKRWIRFVKNGNAMPMDASTYRIQVKSGLSVKLEFRSGLDDSLSIGETTNVIIIYKNAVAMQALDPGVYQYDFQETKTDGTVITWYSGNFTVTDDITKILA